MSHIHTKVIQAVKSLLEGSANSYTTDAIFPFRTRPVDGASGLPFTSAWIPGDSVMSESGGADDEDALIEVEAELMVSSFFAKMSDEELEETLNQGLLDVQALLADGAEIDGVTVRFDYKGCTKHYQDADQDYSELEMRFTFEYAFNQSEPDTLAWQ